MTEIQQGDDQDAVILSSLFNIGHYVEVDGDLKGWILEKTNIGFDLKFKIRYEESNIIEDEVDFSRIKVVSIDNVAIHPNRSGLIRNSDRITQNSDRIGGVTNGQLPDRMQTDNVNRLDSGQDGSHPSHNSPLQQFHDNLLNAYSFKSYDTSTNMKLYTFLKNGETGTKGWLRDIIAEKIINKKSHLSPVENTVLAVVSSIFSGYHAFNGQLRSHTRYIRHAFGVSKMSHLNIIQSLKLPDAVEVRYCTKCFSKFSFF